MKQLESAGFVSADKDVVCRHLGYVLSSERFRKAPSLSHLFRYLVTKTTEGQSDQIKETVIGIEVFGRTVQFDGRNDNIVRVQAHRLRKLLDCYYAEEGAADRLRFIIPKGGYIPHFHFSDERAAAREPADPAKPGATVPVDSSPSAAIHGPGKPPYRWGLVSLIVAFVAGALAVSVYARVAAKAPRTLAAGGESLLSPPLSALWNGILQPGQQTVVAFTNPVFLRAQDPDVYTVYHGPLSAPLGARLDIPASDPKLNPRLMETFGPFFFSDTWTGTGEVLGIHKLTRMFTEAGHVLNVKRSRTVSVDDMRGMNVIFLGSAWANDMLDRIGVQETPFAWISQREGIMNYDPKPGEPVSYSLERNQKTHEQLASHALFSVLPGFDPDRKIIVSAGLDTHATWAAIDFFTSAAGVSELIRRLPTAQSGVLPSFFQAVIRTELIGGQVSNSSLVAARVVDVGRRRAPASAPSPAVPSK